MSQTRAASTGWSACRGVWVGRLGRAYARRVVGVGVGVVVAVMVGGLGASPVLGAGEPGPGWAVQAVAQPTRFSASRDAVCEGEPVFGCDKYTIEVVNVGTRPSSGVVTVVDTLPVGVSVTGASGANEAVHWVCETGVVGGREVVTCSTGDQVAALTPAAEIHLHQLTVEPGVVGPLVNRVVVSGGGVSVPVSTETSTPVEPASVSPFEPEALAFGVLEGFDVSLLGAGGAPDMTAGDHPGSLFTSFAFPSAWFLISPGGRFQPYPVDGEVKQIVTELPVGVVGDALAAPTCPLSDVADLSAADPDACPVSTAVGKLALIEADGVETELTIFNVVPERGYPAEFAVYLPSVGRAGLLYASVAGSGAGTHVQVVSAPLNTIAEFVGASATFFGDPRVVDGTSLEPAAFLTSPSDCAASGFTSTLYVDSWRHPGSFDANGEPVGPNWESASFTAPPVTGCGGLQFHPSFSLTPTASTPDAPTGFNVNLAVPQNEAVQGLATPPLKSVTVTLPQGLVVSPSSASGLEGGTDAQIRLESNEPGSCPAGSQIGEVTVHTPLLEEPLKGEVFLGSPECDPCSSLDAQEGRLVRLFIQVSSERYGVTIKSEGSVSLDPTTGRLVSTFQELPQQPFSDLQFKFKEGPRAPLATPAACGTYETRAALTPWSTPYTPTAGSGSGFTVSGCTGNPFTPTFSAGTTSAATGRFSGFVLSLSRSDQEQRFGVLEAVLAPGLLARLAGVPLCGETEIAEERAGTGECPVGSQIGLVTVAAGPGADPFYVSGKMFLTGGYNGGPFGEVVVVPAVAGPFNLGNVVVRGSFRVNPVTAQGVVVSDPFPSILDGIPLQERSVTVVVERAGGFVFNATSCEPLAVTGTLVSTVGGRAGLSSPYQAAGCRALPFSPVLTAFTQGRASKAAGAS